MRFCIRDNITVELASKALSRPLESFTRIDGTDSHPLVKEENAVLTANHEVE